jgi:hypothetical protein
VAGVWKQLTIAEQFFRRDAGQIFDAMAMSLLNFVGERASH